MHTAAMLRGAGGFPPQGNVAESWREVTNAEDQHISAVHQQPAG